MSNQSQLARIEHEEDAIAAEADGRPVDPYRQASRALRGRWGAIIGFGLMGAALGALAGWEIGQPIYESQGLVQIAYNPPAVMGAEARDRGEPVEIFQAFLGSQQALLGSRRIVDLAMREPVWLATHRPLTARTVREFGESLRIEQRPGSDYLRVIFRDPDPAAAAAAVRSVIRAYEGVYTGEEGRRAASMVAALEQRREALQEQLEALRARSARITADAGLAAAERLYDSAAERMRRIEETLTDVRLAMVLSRENRGLMTMSQIGIVDPGMRMHIANRDAAADALSRLRRLGYGEEHPLVMEAASAVARWDQRIDEYASEYRTAAPAIAAASPAPSGALALAMRSPDQLRADAQGVERLWNEARTDVSNLGAQRMELDAIKAQAASLSGELADVTRRIEHLRVESGVGGRLNVISSGETPIAPVVDQRKKLAAVGGGAGLLVPVGMIVLLGLMSRSYRYSSETEEELSGHMPLLGLLPQLPRSVKDPERMAEAAQSVHQIRVMLQASSRGAGRPAYLVTSASPGEGKTSLVAAMGMSYAASGSRTLLVDCDLVGQSLTNGFRLEQETGLREAIEEGTLNGHVHEALAPNLHVLPGGQGDMRSANTVSARSLGKLLSEARKKYDVVLLDSGPVLGSVEAAALAPQVDGVVLVIARSQSRPVVERALRQLRCVGASLAGMVFNRADPGDVHRSTSSSSSRGRPVVRRFAASDPTSRFGPLVRSVACLLPRHPAEAVAGQT